MKTFNLNNDIVFTFSSFGEHIRFVSSSVSRRSPADVIFVGDSFNQIKTFNHWLHSPLSGGYYQTCYDRDHSRSESIPLMDVTFGVSTTSSVAGKDQFLSGNSEYYSQKTKMYRLYAQQLLGEAGRVFKINGENQHELIFLNIRRNQYKDKIAPGTVRLVMVYSGSISDVYEARVFTDALSDAGIRESAGGLVGDITPLNNTTGLGGGDTTPGVSLTGSELGKVAGQVYYQAGILVLVPKIISNTESDLGNHWYITASVTASYDNIARNNTGSNAIDLNSTFSGIRQRFLQLDFRSHSKLRSTFYTCLAEKEEFNYSSNPSYIDSEGLVRTTSGSQGLSPRTYITKVGLHGANNELIAVGQLSRPVRKDFETEVEITVRLDY